MCDSWRPMDCINRSVALHIHLAISLGLSREGLLPHEDALKPHLAFIISSRAVL